MRRVLRTLALPWRVLCKLRGKLNALVTNQRLLVQLQLTTNAEVRELHQSSLHAAIQLVEEQRLAREQLARDYARLEQRLESLERQLTAGATVEPNRAAA